MKHQAFTSGDFDTNFVRHYFKDPKVMNEAMGEEKEALVHGINQIWDSIKERDCIEFASKEITSSWKTLRS